MGPENAVLPDGDEAKGEENQGDHRFPGHPRGLRVEQNIERRPQGTAGFQPDEEQAEGDKGQAQQSQGPDHAATDGHHRRCQQQAAAGAAADEVSGSPPVPVLLQPGCYAADDTIAGRQGQHRHFREVGGGVLVAAAAFIDVMETGTGADLVMHAESLIPGQQLGDIAVGVVGVPEVEGIGDTGIDAGRGGVRVDARSEAVLQAVIDLVRAEGAFLGDAEAGRVFPFGLVLHFAVAAIGKNRFVDLVAGLIGAGDGAIGAADTDVVIDGDDPVGALLGGR